MPALVVGCTWWLLRRQAWKAALFCSAFLVLTILDYAGKPFFARPRPELFAHPAIGGPPNPSGHARFAVGFYGVMAYLGLVGATRASRWIGWIIWALLAVAIGFSRFGLGVHWRTDVVAGYVAGAVVLLGVGMARRGAHLGEASPTGVSGLAQWPTGSSAVASPMAPTSEHSLRR